MFSLVFLSPFFFLVSITIFLWVLINRTKLWDNTRRKLEYTQRSSKVAIIDLLNSCDCGSSAELTIDAWKFLIIVKTTKSCKEAPVLLRCFLFFSCIQKCQPKASLNHLLTLSWLFYRSQMNSMLFLVTVSTRFHYVWPCKFSSGWLIWMLYIGHCPCRLQKGTKNRAFIWTIAIMRGSWVRLLLI